VRFLVDRCAGRRLAAWLVNQGHDVTDSSVLGPDPGDRALLQQAVTESRIVVTIDTDFPKLVFLGGEAHAGMVRLPDVPAAHRIRLLESVLERHASDLQAGAMVTVKGGKVRISRRDA
jgi:predicted nuclease of predicted toxin-antitoxin system